MTRGVINNNPGNLDAGANWFGLMPREDMTPAQAKETRFAVFQAPKYGFRALAIDLLNYQRRHGLNTVRGIISRFAPPTENDTWSYIQAVSKALGVGTDDVIQVGDKATLRLLCEAISIHENGAWVFSELDLNDGVDAALAA